MLRSKQLGTLSHCARSFLLSNSRCGSGDGASCTCSEDETCASKRQSSSSNIRPQEKKFSVTSAPVSNPGSSCFRNATESVSHHSSETRSYTAPASHVYPPSLISGFSSLNGKVNGSSNNDRSSQNELVHASKLTTEQFIRGGRSTASLLSDFVNYRVPTADGQSLHASQCDVDSASRSCVVDSSKSLSDIKSSKGKTQDKASYSRIQENSSFGTLGEPDGISSTHNDPGVKAMKPSSVKAKKNIPGTSEMLHRSPLDMQGKPRRQCVPQKVKSDSVGFVSDMKSGGKTSERKMAPGIPVDISSANKSQHPTESIGLQVRGRTSGTRSVNAGRVVEQYRQTLQQLKWGFSVEVALDNLHCKLDAFQANQVLKLLRDPSVALKFFNWLKRQARFKHDEHTYTTMIGILGQARQFGAMRGLLQEMVKDGCQPTVVTYNRLIHAYGRANYISEAVKVFQQMQEAGYEPDRVTYCTLIDMYAKGGFLEVALDLYQRMQEVGLSPDTFTYSAMVNCLGKSGHLAAADKLFSEMIERGCVPNLVTYNIMIALQAKARNYPNAVKLYRDMQAAGFRPDKITYSIVMEVLGHVGHLEEAEAVFVEMQKDWVPDEPVYGLLVDMWGKAGNVERAWAWYHSMLDAGLRPNVPTCNSLLSAFLRVQRFSDAFAILQNMLGLGLIPSLQTYTLLLSCCTESRAQMGLCCQLMAISGHPVNTFLLSLPDAEPGGRNVRDHARSFLDLMHSEDRESKRGLVDAVIDFLHKSGLKEEAGSVWEAAAQRNVYPDSVKEKSSSYWLINLHVMSEGTAVTALSRTLAWFRQQLLASGAGPDRIDIITGWGRRSRVTGSSLVRQSVQELLCICRFPFFTEHGNSGCFVGCGEPLNRWLLNSYVERMHLL